jgi:iron complex outermembrane receptor protein
MRTLALPRQRLLSASLAAAFGTASALWGPCAAAQTTATPPASGSTLPAVTVSADSEDSSTSHVNGYVAKRTATATKTETPIIETPQSISVITADRVDAIGARTLGAALGYTPGVTSAYSADSRFDWISLRGFTNYTPGNFLDGMPLRNANTWGLWRTDNYGLERVEVLRGPSSVLFGQGSPGGIVNQTSKRPTAEPLREMKVEVGDHSRRQVSGDFSGPLDEEGKWLYRITGVVRDANLPIDAKEKDNRTYLAPSLTWRPSSDTKLTLLSQFLRDRSGVVYNAAPVKGTLLPNPNGRISASTFLGEPDFDRFNQDQWMVGYQFEHRFSDTWTVRQNLRYGQLKVDMRQTWPGAGFITVDSDNAASPANFRLFDRVAFGSKEKAKQFVVDNQAEAKFQLGSTQHTMLIGLEHQRSRFDQTTFFGGGFAPIDVFAPVYGGPYTVPDPFISSDTTLTQTGIYLQDQIKFGENWVATVGGRYDSAETESTDRLTDNFTKTRSHKFTKRAGLVYLAPNGWAPYVSYSESFTPVLVINPDTKSPFNPETGRQYEAGIRYQPPGTKSSYSAAIFDLRRRNYISYTPDVQPKQTGEVLSRGLELEALFQPIPRMNVTASYTWIPQYKVIASSNPKEIGTQPNAVAKQRVALWVDYRFANGIKAGLGARYSGSTHGEGSAAPVKVPGYTLFDAMVGYDFERWSLALNVRNLTNKAYLGGCDANGCSYGDLRQVSATATYRW